MTLFQISAVILTFAALGGYLNYKYIGLPATIGHMAFALILSLLAVACAETGWFDLETVRDLVGQIDFSQVLLHGMLSFLLFAGALHINLKELKDVRGIVAVLATAGVLAATFITGTIAWLAAGYMGFQLPYIYALLFGALISPTDPIAVLSILRQIGVSKNLYLKIGAESLFNDGVGIVVFTTLLAAAVSPGEIHIREIFSVFMQESMGGLGLGILLGLLTYQLLLSINDYKVEVMMTLALVVGGSALAELLHVSAPLCMVAAGLIVGQYRHNRKASESSRIHLGVFWELIDEILNAILFFLVGMEIMIMPLSGSTVVLGVIATIAVLAGRFISVGVPVSLMRLRRKFDRGTIRLLTWGGLRGGLSLAMALSLPNDPYKAIILPMAYMVVVFSILVQGLTFRHVASMVMGKKN